MALDALVSLLDEAGGEDLQEITTIRDPWKRMTNLQIRSTKMSPFQKNVWLGVLLDLVQEDLANFDWQACLQGIKRGL